MQETEAIEYQYRGLIADGHIDMAYNAVALHRMLTLPVEDIRRAERANPPIDRNAGTCTVSIPELLSGHIAVIGGSVFVEPAIKSRPSLLPVYKTPDEARYLAIKQLDYYNRIEDEQDNVRLLRNVGDLDDVLHAWEHNTPELGVFVIMEGAEPIESPDTLEWWLERGVRGVGLTWSLGTRYAGGNAAPGPLTDDGVALLNAMADYQMLLDISHMWIDAAHQALDRYPGMVVATHANPRRFADSPRQIPDEIIRLIAERDGVVGIVAYAPMLNVMWRVSDPAIPLSKLVDAIDYICQLTGRAENVAIGSDLDGGFGREYVPAGLDSVADLRKIGTQLKIRGYADSDIEAILYKNWVRIMRGVLEGVS